MHEQVTKIILLRYFDSVIYGENGQILLYYLFVSRYKNPERAPMCCAHELR